MTTSGSYPTPPGGGVIAGVQRDPSAQCDWLRDSGRSCLNEAASGFMLCQHHLRAAHDDGETYKRHAIKRDRQFNRWQGTNERGGYILRDRHIDLLRAIDIAVRG